MGVLPLPGTRPAGRPGQQARLAARTVVAHTRWIPGRVGVVSHFGCLRQLAKSRASWPWGGGWMDARCWQRTYRYWTRTFLQMRILISASQRHGAFGRAVEHFFCTEAVWLESVLLWPRNSPLIGWSDPSSHIDLSNVIVTSTPIYTRYDPARLRDLCSGTTGLP